MPELQKYNKHCSMIIKLYTNSAGNIDGHIINVNINIAKKRSGRYVIARYYRTLFILIILHMLYSRE